MLIQQFFDSITFTDADVSAFSEFLRILDGEETSDVLKRYLSFGSGAVERATRRIVKKRNFTLTFTAENDDTFPIPLHPVRALSSVTVSGETVSGSLAVSGGGYELKLAHPVSGLVIAVLSIGYDSTIPAPDELTAAVYSVAADMYEHREFQSERTLSENKTVRLLIDSLRIPEV